MRNERRYAEVERVLSTFIDMETAVAGWTLAKVYDKVRLIMGLIKGSRIIKMEFSYNTLTGKFSGSLVWSEDGGKSEYAAHRVAINQTVAHPPLGEPTQDQDQDQDQEQEQEPAEERVGHPQIRRSSHPTAAVSIVQAELDGLHHTAFKRLTNGATDSATIARLVREAVLAQQKGCTVIHGKYDPTTGLVTLGNPDLHASERHLYSRVAQAVRGVNTFMDVNAEYLQLVLAEAIPDYAFHIVTEIPVDPTTDFTEGQWWITELDQAAAASTDPDFKRSVATVHHLLRSVRALESRNETRDRSL